MTRLALKCLLVFVLMCGSATAAEPALLERAQKGDAAAQLDLGKMYYDGDGVLKDSTEAVKWFHKAAEQGDAGAQSLLSAAYYFGDGVPKDSAEAMKWCRKAAEQGLAIAQFGLGSMYATGEGVTKDSTEAAKWYRKAAEQGYVRAQFLLGKKYRTGDGVPKDAVEAAKWFRKAGEQGNADAQCLLGTMYGMGEGVTKDSTEAVKWYHRAAEQGYALAQFKIGQNYFDGEEVAKDSKEAVKWYRKAAEQGFAMAQYNLGVIYANGDGVPQDSIEAVKWYRKAAAQGHADAQDKLGFMYAGGDGVPKSSTEAAKWFRKAAEQGNTGSQFIIGIMYAAGDGLPKDEVEGLAWINIAAASGIAPFVKNRDELEGSVGRERTLVAQQRSKQILKEIEAAKRASVSPLPKDSATQISPVEEKSRATGSGVIVSTQGHVLTAAHVVAGASWVKIVTAHGLKTATVLRVDEANDLAVLKLVDGIYPGLPVVPSRRIRLGQSVATIGFPNVEIQDFSPKVTRGEISSLNGIGDDPRAWQISVPVQTGNSGGALLDENGNVIGVVMSKLGLKALKATGDIPQNVNYAVKSTYALALLEPYLDSTAPEPNQSAAKPRFEDMVAKAQQSVVLILVY